MAGLLTFFATAGQHLGRMAALVTFSAATSQHLGCMAALLTFSAAASQHLGCMVGLLTFSAAASQHLGSMADLLTFLLMTFSIEPSVRFLVTTRVFSLLSYYIIHAYARRCVHIYFSYDAYL